MVFFTAVTPDYRELGEKWGQSCLDMDLRVHVQPVTLRSSWKETEREKPQWILRQLMEIREPVCWCDADTEIVRLPSLLLNHHFDFAAYNWCADQNNSVAHGFDPQKCRISGGVLAFAYSAPVMELLVRWCSHSAANHDAVSTDQTLDHVLNTFRPPLKCLWLPKSYNRHDQMWPHIEPVINHVYRHGGHSSISEPYYKNLPTGRTSDSDRKCAQD